MSPVAMSRAVNPDREETGRVPETDVPFDVENRSQGAEAGRVAVKIAL